jgi:hypothetical protein
MIAEMMSCVQSGRTPVHIACEKYDPSIIALLLSNGAKIGTKDKVSVPYDETIVFKVFSLDRLQF